MLQHPQEAEDLLQESFVKIFNGMQSFDQQSNFYTWAKRIAINSCINHQNKKGLNYTLDYEREVAMQPADEEYSEEETRWTVERINHAILQLPDGYREVLSLYLLEGYDHNEIAGILKVSPSTSKSQYARAKKKLKQILSHG